MLILTVAGSLDSVQKETDLANTNCHLPAQLSAPGPSNSNTNPGSLGTPRCVTSGELQSERLKRLEDPDLRQGIPTDLALSPASAIQQRPDITQTPLTSEDLGTVDDEYDDYDDEEQDANENDTNVLPWMNPLQPQTSNTQEDAQDALQMSDLEAEEVKLSQELIVLLQKLVDLFKLEIALEVSPDLSSSPSPSPGPTSNDPLAVLDLDQMVESKPLYPDPYHPAEDADDIPDEDTAEIALPGYIKQFPDNPAADSVVGWPWLQASRRACQITLHFMTYWC